MCKFWSHPLEITLFHTSHTCFRNCNENFDQRTNAIITIKEQMRNKK